MDLRQLLKSVDSLIASNPGLTLKSLAKELNVTAWTIEKAVREVDGVSFSEYVENRQLAYVLGAIEEKREAENHKSTRAEPRSIIPGATVAYILHGIGIREPSPPVHYPIFDLSSGGMAFLSDRPLKPGKRVSLFLNCVERKDELQLEGDIVYALASEIAGYQYRVGVRFIPFEAKEGCNSPEARESLAKLIKKACSQVAEPLVIQA